MDKTIRGSHFTCFHAGPKEGWTEYRLEPPDVPLPARGKLFLRNLLESAGLEMSLNVAPPGKSIPFMLFGTQDHGSLLTLAGQKRKAIQYVVGNPLFALQMTQHDIRASLYAPLRVLIYEDNERKTCVEYDKPSSLFGQFGNDRIAPTAAMLDRKLEALVAEAFK